jgi:CheY-like chemotaxis protein
MARLRLIHTRASEAAPLIGALERAGYQVDWVPHVDTAELRRIRQAPPDAIAIDLSRLPSYGKYIAVALRRSKPTRRVPLVILEGAPEKVAPLRELLPDAVYTDREGLLEAVAGALANPPENPVVPSSQLEVSIRTAAQKLGIRAGATIGVIDPPGDYLRVLGTLPEDVSIEEDPEKPARLTLWFVHDPDEYRERLPRMRRWAAAGKLWILWAKRSASKDGRITQPLIREPALALGLVDYKVCSVNETWSGLLFTLKK